MYIQFLKNIEYSFIVGLKLNISLTFASKKSGTEKVFEYKIKMRAKDGILLGTRVAQPPV